MSNSVRLLIAFRVFTVIATERCPGKQAFLKNSWSITLPPPSLVKVLEIYLWRSSFFVIILLILLENELLYNFEEIPSQFRSKQLTGWFSICIHVCDAFSDLIPFSSLKNVKISCGRVLFLVKMWKVPGRKTHHLSIYIVLCINISRVLTPWSCCGSSPILASNSKQIYLN